MTRPADKPKPAPAPVAEKAEGPAAVEETPAPEPEQEEEAAAEPIESFGDAPAASEVEEQAAALPETVPEPETTAPQSDELLPEGNEEEEYEDPVIAGSGGNGSQPEWVKDAQEPPKTEPEPVTTYTGPPGFNSPTATKGPIAQVQAQAPAVQPRSNSRAAQRYKNADGQGVVLPTAVNSSLGNVEMQFGSLSFGGLNGDGADAPPAPEPVAPAETQAPAPVAQSTQNDYTMPSPKYKLGGHDANDSLRQFQQQAQQLHQPQQPQQPQHAQQVPPHVTLQQQATAFNNQYQQQQQPHQHQPQQHQQQQQSQDPAQSQNAHPFYRQAGTDFYGSQSQEPAAQQSQPQPQQGQQPASATAYDSAFGGFGQQSQLYGQGQQQQHHQQQPSQANDAYSAGRTPYDSYAASGYPRQAEEQKPAAPAPTHTPTAPAQQPQQGLHQQNQYYSQLGGNMGGYYQGGPAYNPYYQCKSTSYGSSVRVLANIQMVNNPNLVSKVTTPWLNETSTTSLHHLSPLPPSPRQSLLRLNPHTEVHPTHLRPTMISPRSDLPVSVDSVIPRLQSNLPRTNTHTPTSVSDSKTPLVNKLQLPMKDSSLLLPRVVLV
jgi:hypothetical protein